MQAQRKKNNKIDRPAWDAFIEASPQGGIYALGGYMDAIAPDWEGIEVYADGRLVGLMPFCQKKKFGYQVALQPPFSQFWGVFFHPQENQNPYTEYSEKRKILNAILQALPKKIDWMGYGFSPQFDYPLPFHWAGFRLQTRYSYHLSLEKPEKEIFADFRKNLRYDIRQVEKHQNQLFLDAPASDLLHLLDLNTQKGKKLIEPKERARLSGLVNWLEAEKMAKIISLKSEAGEILAAGLFGRFRDKEIYLLSAQNPENKDAGVMGLLIWEAIKAAKNESIHQFDFEGSMIESIETFFRGFSPKPVPYLYIHKNRLPLLLQWIQNSL